MLRNDPVSAQPFIPPATGGGMPRGALTPSANFGQVHVDTAGHSTGRGQLFPSGGALASVQQQQQQPHHAAARSASANAAQSHSDGSAARNAAGRSSSGANISAANGALITVVGHPTGGAGNGALVPAAPSGGAPPSRTLQLFSSLHELIMELSTNAVTERKQFVQQHDRLDEFRRLVTDQDDMIEMLKATNEQLIAQIRALQAEAASSAGRHDRSVEAEREQRQQQMQQVTLLQQQLREERRQRAALEEQHDHLVEEQRKSIVVLEARLRAATGVGASAVALVGSGGAPSTTTQSQPQQQQPSSPVAGGAGPRPITHRQLPPTPRAGSAELDVGRLTAAAGGGLAAGASLSSRPGTPTIGRRVLMTDVPPATVTPTTATEGCESSASPLLCDSNGHPGPPQAQSTIHQPRRSMTPPTTRAVPLQHPSVQPQQQNAPPRQQTPPVSTRSRSRSQSQQPQHAQPLSARRNGTVAASSSAAGTGGMGGVTSLTAPGTSSVIGQSRPTTTTHLESPRRPDPAEHFFFTTSDAVGDSHADGSPLNHTNNAVQWYGSEQGDVVVVPPTLSGAAVGNDSVAATGGTLMTPSRNGVPRSRFSLARHGATPLQQQLGTSAAAITAVASNGGDLNIQPHSQSDLTVRLQQPDTARSAPSGSHASGSHHGLVTTPHTGHYGSGPGFSSQSASGNTSARHGYGYSTYQQQQQQPYAAMMGVNVTPAAGGVGLRPGPSMMGPSSVAFTPQQAVGGARGSHHHDQHDAATAAAQRRLFDYRQHQQRIAASASTGPGGDAGGSTTGAAQPDETRQERMRRYNDALGSMLRTSQQQQQRASSDGASRHGGGGRVTGGTPPPGARAGNIGGASGALHRTPASGMGPVSSLQHGHIASGTPLHSVPSTATVRGGPHQQQQQQRHEYTPYTQQQPSSGVPLHQIPSAQQQHRQHVVGYPTGAYHPHQQQQQPLGNLMMMGGARAPAAASTLNGGYPQPPTRGAYPFPQQQQQQQQMSAEFVPTFRASAASRFDTSVAPPITTSGVPINTSVHQTISQQQQQQQHVAAPAGAPAPSSAVLMQGGGGIGGISTSVTNDDVDALVASWRHFLDR